MSANARTALIALVTAIVFFALGRVTRDSAALERAEIGAHAPAVHVDEPTEEQLAAGVLAATSARTEVVTEPIADLAQVAPTLDEMRGAEAAKLAELLESYRSPSNAPAPPVKPTLHSWEEAKLEMRSQFEVNHEDAQHMRDRLFRLDFEFEIQGRWRHSRLDARERSGARIASVLGDLAGASMLTEPSATRARVLVAECRDALIPIVERAIDAWEAARFEVWRRELGVIWREGEPEPRAPKSVERGAYNCGGQSAWSRGWRMRYVLDSADHPEFEALLLEIERIKAACVEQLAALGS